MKYKAIIFDLDGTAIPNKPNGQPSKRLVEAIYKAKNKFKLCVATGRPISNASYILETLNLTDPCIISAGTQIIDPVTKKILWEKIIETADIKRVLEICSPYPYEVLFKEELMGAGQPAALRKVEGAINVMYLMQLTKRDAAIILQKLKEVKGITASGVPSWTQEGVDIHITNSQATKEQAIHKLLSILKLSKKEVIGIGDGDNDIHLFKSVGWRIAMGNATDYMKANADIVTESVEDDGLAVVIENYCNSEGS